VHIDRASRQGSLGAEPPDHALSSDSIASVNASKSATAFGVLPWDNSVSARCLLYISGHIVSLRCDMRSGLHANGRKTHLKPLDNLAGSHLVAVITAVANRYAGL